jgi:hypothetical protein
VSFFVNNGVLAANYTIQIRSIDDDKVLYSIKGNNANGNIDHTLDIPVSTFDKSVLMAVIDFKGLDLSLSHNFDLGIEIKQGNNSLGTQNRTGTLVDDFQNVQIFIELQMS